MPLIIFLLFLNSCKNDSDQQINRIPAYEKNIFNSSTILLPYQILKPIIISKNTPIVLFLHGAGERGENNQNQLIHGSQKFLDSIDLYPALYLFPQCPVDDYWANVDVNRYGDELQLIFDAKAGPTPSMQAVMELMDDLIHEYKLNSSGHKVMGLSMGGMGTFEILNRKPELFNTAIAICGGGNPEYVDNYSKDLNLWIAHGEKDNVVNVKESVLMHEAAKSAGLNVRFTIYPDIEHDSWTNVFEEADYLKYLFQ